MTEPAPVDLEAGEGGTPAALRRLAADVLPGYVLRRRWYAAKDAGPPRVRPVASDPLPTDAGPALLAVFEMTPPARPAQLYFLPLMTVAADTLTPDDPAVIASAGDGRLVIDAFATDAFVRALVAAVRGEGGVGAVRFARTPAFAAVEGALDGAPEVRRSTVEQSNSSARVGGALMMKCFRKLDPGTHPELEMGRHLTAAGFANTPDLLGWIERGDGRDGSLTLAVLQSLVENEGDGWAHVLDGLRGVPNADAAAFADRLGRRTAELHRVLAAPTDDPAFRPEPVGPDDLAAWRASIHDLASRAMAGLERSPAGQEGEAARLLARRGEVTRRIDELCPDTAEAARTRLHGDYHLGQVLVTADGDAVIIDFEGEPMRPLPERRTKHSPLRDVAGMLRSFAYAGAAVERDAASDGGAAPGRGPSEAAAHLAGVFLDRYRAAIEGCPSLPAEPADAARLLRLFLLEKALYEVGYEIANRPDWLAIPIKGVLALLDDPQPSDSWPRPATLAGAAPKSALDRLAERVGIETVFENAAGETVRPSDATKRALLKALGVEAASDEDAAAELERIERAERLSPLPPAAVGAEGRPVELTLALPEGTGDVAWTIRREDGGGERGVAAFADLALIDAGEAEGRTIERRRWRLKHASPQGYHRLGVEAGGVTAEASLITAPPRCYLPPTIEAGGRVWGIAFQLHLLRSAGNWGLGDFGDLKRLAALVEGWGSAMIGLNPVHAMFPDNPDHASPYSPASRLFLNILYIDVTAVPGFAGCAPARAVVEGEGAERLRACREADLVDFAGVTRLKLAALEHLFADFRRGADPARTKAFERFRREGGEPLERLCRFYALRERLGAEGGPEAADWRRWPAAYRDVGSPEVEAFAAEHAERIAFHAWTQWLADEQLGAAARAARAAEGAIGLYRDLAVGADGSGAEPWCDPKLVAASARVGAPPDLYMPGGQDWGLPPLNPAELRRDAYRGFIALVRANMRHAGALRIDHAMALLHVYWIPEGRPPSEGSYVAYPFEDLLGILALESVRHGCLVIGEDLGTVPRGFRERMTEAAILSYRVLFFEQDEAGAFTPPEGYPDLALATIGNHDLATLRGWWESRDIDLKARHGLYPDAAEKAKQRALREEQRAAFLEALHAAGIDVPEGFDTSSPFAGDLALAAHAFLARTRSALALVQLDDLTDEADQVNLPGTTDAYPNWRRKLARPLEDLARDPGAVLLTAPLVRERGGAGDGAPASGRPAPPA